MALTVHSVVGTRPNFMKIAPLIKAFAAHDVKHTLIHTGQHFDTLMSDVFFDELNMPRPDIHLNIPGGTALQQTGAMLPLLESIFLRDRPDLVLVVGDVTSTFAAALAANRCGIKVAHVEAGLRSNDRSMPEEINRLLVDNLSDMHFVTEQSGIDNLIKEGIPSGKIHFVGNVMIDTLVANASKFVQTNLLAAHGLQKGNYVVLTLHRPSNVDTQEGLLTIARILKQVAARGPIVWPVHPRTKKNIERFNLMSVFSDKNLIMLPPQGYLEFMQFVSNSSAALTDSGGIQEETTYLGVKCLTMRENTERPSTVDHGTNTIVGLDEKKILSVLSLPTRKGGIPPLWDGHAAERIVDIIMRTS